MDNDQEKGLFQYICADGIYNEILMVHIVATDVSGTSGWYKGPVRVVGNDISTNSAKNVLFFVFLTTTDCLNECKEAD